MSSNLNGASFAEQNRIIALITGHAVLC